MDKTAFYSTPVSERAMSMTDLPTTTRGTLITGLLTSIAAPDGAALRGSSIGPLTAARPSVKIARRTALPPWRNPRRLDPATIGKFLILGKSLDLFHRDCSMRFAGTSAKARRKAKARSKARKTRRWEPVVISPVFPRGPLELPSLGFFERRMLSGRRRKRRPAMRARILRAGDGQNLSSAACSSA